ncbi:hypothetical protein K493DRAFT_99293 [Basidiobolus meristosporus CBS 931.73]|uniref:Uncharacterized protein n=1 Tax=Basidiobolus meristosporus CBS 931.73 TaxID=1314790 RepID=A0A1Y1X2K6_9FUNG|nr:hypothetical protein K493DRAFT_99293 [Basidiobolus meristosporus CBS 931.73]|eukprot:ORX79868.1 hypothetical protein K493DRAFT_99293 [Basidiobolus meristosporus CBS 931.73]
MGYSINDVLLLVIGFFIPPLSVFVKRGLHADFWINVGLTLLGAVPGILHAWYIVHKYRDFGSDYEALP